MKEKTHLPQGDSSLLGKWQLHREAQLWMTVTAPRSKIISHRLWP